ncbi:MAG: B12-binding domain-containing radical SAM protein [Verrucomicrobiae bacterium]|nr:B12-binding domain-containing radical SAM protein [Verrucomicrobiae bacterium]
MSEIVLTTINAKYIHTAFGLRYLYANLGELRTNAEIIEFDLQSRPSDIAETLLNRNPRIIGIGVYIWNARLVDELVAILKNVSPETIIILGGPEISFEWEEQKSFKYCDYIICGEGDIEFYNLCRRTLSGDLPDSKVIKPLPPQLDNIALPYEFYTEKDIMHRIVYVESSRGCPFKCEFCISSLDERVRYFPVDAFLNALDTLIRRGARQLKFVDRTFNVDVKHGEKILEFCLQYARKGIFFHFELVPDRFPERWKEVIKEFPPATIQFEVGIQTFNHEVSERISRWQNYEKLISNLRFLREETGVHLHTDLIAGLPGEDMKSFQRGFDSLAKLRPQEIQVGILKRLRGVPISRHDKQWGMVYNPEPPYEILKTSTMSFEELQRIKKFARYWDMIANSGNFTTTTELILELDKYNSSNSSDHSPFNEFMQLTEWLFAKTGRTTAISRDKLVALLFEYLISQKHVTEELAAECLIEDCKRVGFRELPEMLRPFLKEKLPHSSKNSTKEPLKRQIKHVDTQ